MNNRTEGRKVLTFEEKITQANIIDGGNAVDILFKDSKLKEKKRMNKVQAQPGSQEFEDMFPIVDIENVSLEDRFMQYNPEYTYEWRIQRAIIAAKEKGMKNFRIPAMDPSFDDDGETIIYCAGRKPAVGKSPEWWYENAPKFLPNKNSRMRDIFEYDVAIGVMLIKYFVEEKGYKVKEAWKTVCDFNMNFGHYRNSKNAKHDFEKTGSRQIGKCFDLGNTGKIVTGSNRPIFLRMGGSYDEYSWYVNLLHYNDIHPNIDLPTSVGSLVLDV